VTQPSFQQQQPGQPYPGPAQQPLPAPTSPHAITPTQTFNPIKKRSPWGGWWLMVITCGVYYFVWYHKVNAELAAVTGQRQAPWGQWWNQIIPVWGLFGLHHTAVRLNNAHAAVGSSVRVSPGVAWFWAPIWFGSQARYLQRRINQLGDILSVMNVQQAGR
jgi:hypothetical protein